MFNLRVLFSILYLLNYCKGDLMYNVFFVTKQYRVPLVYCVTNSSSALAWNEKTITSSTHTPKTEIVPKSSKSYLNCDFSVKTEPCLTFWQYGNWWVMNSLNGPIKDLVLDRRWEEFKVYFTDGEKQYNYVDTIKLTGDFTIPLSIRTQYEAHILLCDNDNPPKANCYWFLLEAWKGYGTGIRKCRKGTVPDGYKIKYASDRFCNELKVSNNDTHFFNETEWRHFWISKKGDTMTFSFRDQFGMKQLLLEYIDGDFDVKYLLLNSKHVSAIWKFHEYHYLYTNGEHTLRMGPVIKIANRKLCISMFVAMCKECILKLTLKSKQDSVVLEKTLDGQDAWVEIQLKKDDILEKDLVLYVTTSRKNNVSPIEFYWAIDKIRECHLEEFRKLFISYQEATCQMVSAYNSSLSLLGHSKDGENVCPYNTISSFCLPCNLFWNSTNCPQLSICEKERSGKTKCSCSAGYTGSICDYTCSRSSYGFSCKNVCGKCAASFTCDHINGYCRTDDDQYNNQNCSSYNCENGYEGCRCDRIRGTYYFLTPLMVITVNYTSCILKATFAFSADLPLKPKYYKIQYREKSESRTQWNSIKLTLDKDTVLVSNLTVDTEYIARPVVLADDQTYDYQDFLIPISTFRTLCEDFTLKDLDIKPFNTSIQIIFNRAELHCKIESYSIYVGTIYYSNGIKNITITQLKAYTEYKLTIMNNKSGHTIVEKSVKTSEGRPREVTNLYSSFINSTCLNLTWTKPIDERGIVRNYTILLTPHGSIACSGYQLPAHPRIEVSLKLHIIINNLIPYSKYTIEIFASTDAFRGDTFIKLLETPALEYVDFEKEKPEVEVYDCYIRFYYSSEHCYNIYGSINARITLYCKSDWCWNKNKIILNLDSNNKFEFLDNIEPFTDYSLSIELCRDDKKTCRSESSLIITEPAAPGPVRDILIYSKNSTSFTFRMKRPYPPRGVLKKYIISIRPCLNQYMINCLQSRITVKHFNCLLWAEYDCITITNLTENTTYYFTVSAVNEEPTDNGTESRILNVYTQKSAPQSPLSINISWTDDDHLLLTWDHPLVTNGDLIDFKIFVGNTRQSIQEIYHISKYNLTYSHKLKEELFPSEVYNVSVQSYNGFQYVYSFSNMKHFASPPPKVLLQAEPTIIDLNLRIPPIRQNITKLIEECSIYILNHDGNIGDIKLFGQLLKQTNSSVKYNIIFNKSNILNDLKEGFSYKINENHTLYNYSLFKPGKKQILTIFLETDQSVKSNDILFSLIIVPCFLLSIGAVFIWRKRRELRSFSRKDEIDIEMCLMNLLQIEPQNDYEPPPNLVRLSVGKDYAEITGRKEYSFSVKISDFENYIRDSIENGELERQHNLFPRATRNVGPPKSYGELNENLSKNRYKNLIAYDETRVVLQEIEGVPFSDYINANYIEGFKCPRAYIATQGPLKSTIYDFWRMIWQENVETVVMVANCTEGGKMKVEPYWPSVNQTLNYNDISIHFKANEVHAEFESTELLIEHKNGSRKITHLHFTSWPDHGVPLYSQSLVPFLQRMLKIPQSSRCPLVVHCSAGVGRTGTIILCDISLRMAARTGSVDLFNVLSNIRKARPNMVDNVEQYKLAHLVVLECLTGMRTGISCDQIDQIERIINQNNIETQMKYLKETSWQDNTMKNIAGEHRFIAKGKNRFPDIIPEPQGQIFLKSYPITDEHSIYINAIFVDGFHYKQQYIVTQQPLPETLGDFWRLIEENGVTVIVSLNKIDEKEKTSCELTPTKENPIMVPVDYIRVEYKNEQVTEVYKQIYLHMFTKNKSDYQKIQVISFLGWMPRELLPCDMDTFLKFWEVANKMARNTQPVITCFDGVTASGLFLAMSFIAEKIKLEHICDVCQAVRAIRHNRKQFVDNEEQFTFLYRSTLRYVKNFQSYANFK